MHKFAQLLDRLYYTHSYIEKSKLLQHYFSTTPDPERGFAIAIIANQISFKYFKRSLVQELVEENCDPILFRLCYDYVGDLSETVALLWRKKELAHLPPLPVLSEMVERFSHAEKSALKAYLTTLLDLANAHERWAIVKLATGDLRIGVSQRFLKQALANWGQKNIQEIEEVWHAVKPPYIDLFNWLRGKSEKPQLADRIYFHPVMLAHPIEDKEIEKISANEFAVEWKYDGIRVQVVSNTTGIALFSRTGDDISSAFPDLIENIQFNGVLDGELVIKREEGISTFNELQQRLNRKKPSKNMMEMFPAHIVLYDVLALNGTDLRALPFTERRARLQTWYAQCSRERLSLSPLLTYEEDLSIRVIRDKVLKENHPAVEGLMIKKKQSPYLPGRPKGHWYKWKRDPYLVDAVLMYAQRGHGNRSSFYSDYTFGLWYEQHLLPIGKAYFGFTDEELRELDKWIRKHTIQKFGPVREVEKSLVFEVAFEAVQRSKRHKSGIALRFPRINRIRWDKPAKEADQLEALEKLLK